MMNQSLFSALWLEKTAIGITIGLIVMVAALNIVATLILHGDGEAQGHRDPGVDGRLARRDHAHLHAAGDGDRGGRDARGRGAGLGARAGSSTTTS